MMRLAIAVLVLAAVLLGTQAARAVSPTAAPAASTAATKAQSQAPAAAAGPTVESIYTADRLRDPFRTETPGMVVKRRFRLAEFSIHNLTLKGIMADRAADFAVFADPTNGYTMMLRKGRLLDPRGRPVPGVTGRLDVKQRRASLQTQDGDVQVFRLGVQSMD